MAEQPKVEEHAPKSAVERVCFRLHVRPDRINDHWNAHAKVWPEMLQALEQSGWRNDSLFLADDGLLIGYFETVSLAAALDSMQQHKINERWQEAMADYFVGLETTPDQGFVQLTEVFNLGDQLASVALQATPQTMQGRHNT